MQHDPDGSWIADPDPDHLKGTQPLLCTTEHDKRRTFERSMSCLNIVYDYGLKTVLNVTVPTKASISSGYSVYQHNGVRVG